MSTYSASKTVALAQSAEEGAALSGRPLSLAFSLPAGGTGVFAGASGSGTLTSVGAGDAIVIHYSGTLAIP